MSTSDYQVYLPDELQPGTHLEGRIYVLDHFHDSGGFGLGRLDDRTWFMIDDGDLVGFIAGRDDDVGLFSFGNVKVVVSSPFMLALLMWSEEVI